MLFTSRLVLAYRENGILQSVRLISARTIYRGITFQVINSCKLAPLVFIVDLRINETLQTGAVGKPHLPGDESVYLFLTP